MCFVVYLQGLLRPCKGRSVCLQQITVEESHEGSLLTHPSGL